jgi:phosphatidyl-myo-inositol dimannoside synthase
VVYASTSPGAGKFDADQPFPVIRAETSMLLPTPAIARRAAQVARAYHCDRIWFGAAAPLGLLAPALRRWAGIHRALAMTHGHEVGWAALPGARSLLRRIGREVDVVTYLGEYFRARLAPVVANLERLRPGVDLDAFSPSVDGSAVRRRYGLGDRPVIVCVSRLVARKGQDALVRALPMVRSRVPDAALLIVGEGPYRSTLDRMVRQLGLSKHVVFTGPPAPAELPAHYAAGTVYAMPCRTRHGGLDVEGLGLVYLEASASGLPVIAGDSGGAPDAVRDGVTGFVVNGRDVPAIAARITALLQDSSLAQRMGAAGRAWVESDWRWETQAARLTDLLRGP